MLRLFEARCALVWIAGVCLVCAGCSKSDDTTPGGQPTTAAGSGASAAPPTAAGAAAPAGAGASGGSAGPIGVAGTGIIALSGRGGAAGVGGGGTGAGAGAPAAGSGGGAAGAGAAAGNGGGSAAGTGAAGAGAGAPNATTDIWISPSGADTGAGTEAMPLASLAAAVEKVMPGGTIWVTAGSYMVSETVSIKRAGTEGMPLQIFAAPGARPVFDFKAQPRGQSSARGIQISGAYWHIRGIDFTNAGDNCIHISGAHNTIENVATYGCGDSGLQITANSSDAANKDAAAYNTVLNCDSHDNYDAQNQGENADGFAAKLYIGPGNVFRGCRAWNNADDGWDLFASDDVVVIEDCWAIANGKIGPAQNNTNGDGNGFKLGGAAQAGDANMGGAVHQVKNCISVENAACGYTRNNNTQTPKLTMCGGRGDGKGLLCSLSGDANVPVTMTAAQAIAVKRDPDGNLPPPP